MANLNDIIEHLDQLPALPASASRLVGLLSSGCAEIGELERVIRVDEAISAAVLRCANSVRFGRPGRVFTLRESITRLGARALLRIALAQQFGSVLQSAGSAYGLHRGSLWRGAMAGALAAEEIARHHGVEPDLAFLCGLLRDIGKLALDQIVDPRELERAADALPEEASFLEAERILVGADHAKIGGAIARRWGLPERIARAIENHHEPAVIGSRDHDPLGDVVHAADVVCLWTGLATGADGLRYPIQEHVRATCLPGRREAESLIAKMWSRLNEIEAELGHALSEEKRA